MAIVKVGNTNLTVVNIDRDFDPQTGWRVVFTYQGFQDPCNAQAALSATQGAKTSVRQFQGPVYRATISWGNSQDGSAEVPVDRWERVTEYVQEPLANNPNIIAAAGADGKILSKWLKEIRKDLDSDVPQGLDATASDSQRAVYDLMSRGVQAHEVKRFVLRRRRTISLFYADVAVPNAVENIYSTAKLAQVFGIPNVIFAKLPATPASAPSNTVWSWKERADDSQYTPAYNKSEEVKDWVFAAWSTVVYNLIGPASAP